jgi:hypothetical protein
MEAQPGKYWRVFATVNAEIVSEQLHLACPVCVYVSENFLRVPSVLGIMLIS